MGKDTRKKTEGSLQPEKNLDPESNSPQRTEFILQPHGCIKKQILLQMSLENTVAPAKTLMIVLWENES